MVFLDNYVPKPKGSVDIRALGGFSTSYWILRGELNYFQVMNQNIKTAITFYPSPRGKLGGSWKSLPYEYKSASKSASKSTNGSKYKNQGRRGGTSSGSKSKYSKTPRRRSQYQKYCRKHRRRDRCR